MDHLEALATIARLTFPDHEQHRVSIRCADHVERQRSTDAAVAVAEEDWLVDLANIEEAGPNLSTTRHVSPISTGVLVSPGQSAQITASRTPREFRCQRLIISNAGTAGGAADWLVNDIVINDRSQFVQEGDIPGDMFAVSAIDTFVAFETAPPLADIVVTVTYIGINEKGCPFYATMMGTAGADMPEYVRIKQPEMVVTGITEAGFERLADGGNLMHTKVLPGFAYASRTYVTSRIGGVDGDPTEREVADSVVTITIAPIDAELLDVAVDAALTNRARTPAVDAVISQALDGRPGGNLAHDVYVAFVMQRADELLAEESRAM